ncbi:SLBB domain-containing protein [Devosia sp. 2618]|uniref:SLBB domain-containing protein n=1 Tax=Devosia sp. 2618 TaxID=3156454 RepID=UPI0033930B9C
MSHFQLSGAHLHRARFWAALLTTVSFATIASAAPAPLAPLTKLRLTVVQFIASTGDYKRWDALGGDFEVAADGTLNVPTLGPIDVSSLSADALGADISARLQAKLGLLDAPDASVQVLEYPPVYVVGSVSTPGQYPFRPGMTVAQALALAGGERRLDSSGGLSETIKLQSDLDGFSNDILRITARLARLKTEFDRGTQITFPAVLDTTDPTTAEILQQERRIFEAHTNEFARQQDGLKQLADLFTAEIDALGQKATAIDDQITRATQQVTNITGLVSSGSATVARLTDAQRILSDLQSSKLDNIIATMSARENLSNAQRDLAKLQDQQQSDGAAQLQQEQANLEQLTLNQTTTMRMLRQSVESDENTTLARTAQMIMGYSILRQQDGQPATVAATEDSVLLPGDLVKVTMQMQMPMATTAAAAQATATP